VLTEALFLWLVYTDYILLLASTSVLWTRGYTPWRPDAVIGTVGRENNTFPQIFKDRRERTGHPESGVLSRPLDPISSQSDFRVSGR